MRAKATARLRHGTESRTWDDVIPLWTKYITAQVGSIRTAKRYAGSLIIAGRHITGPIADIDKNTINRFVTARRAEGVSNATIRRDLQAISSLLDFAEDEGWREGNPAQAKMRRIKEHRDPITIPDEGDYAFVLSRLQHGHAELLRAARATGIRQTELATIRRKAFNAATGALLVRGKGNKQRTIQLSPEAAEIFTRQPEGVADGVRCETVFHHNGRPITKAAFIFSRARRAAQQAAQKEKRPFRGFRFHDMRHWYAIEYLRGGGDIYTLKEHLRHSSVKTTETYLEFLTPEEAENAKRGKAKVA